MIISASYKTDIPAFYGEWFVNRLDAGYCKITNPYNRRVSRVELNSASVDGFVFWTKNLGPFIRHLPRIAELKKPFVVQYTINGYPRALERNVTPPAKSTEHVREVVARWGPGTVVWRYDTIVFSSLTPPAFHLGNFAGLANALRGFVDEVVVSFMHVYDKTQRNLEHAASEEGFSWTDPGPEEKSNLLRDLVKVSRNSGMLLSVCSQPQFLVDGTSPARCIDAGRLSRVSGEAIEASVRGNRPGCECSASKDIGEYDTCPQGCVYCYAVVNQQLAKTRFHEHDPGSEFLFAPVDSEALQGAPRRQLPLL